MLNDADGDGYIVRLHHFATFSLLAHSDYSSVLGKACVRNDSMKSTADLGLVANGFTSRYPLFDFVDVGLGMERADHKIRGICFTSEPMSHELIQCRVVSVLHR